MALLGLFRYLQLPNTHIITIIIINLRNQTRKKVTKEMYVTTSPLMNDHTTSYELLILQRRVSWGRVRGRC